MRITQKSIFSHLAASLLPLVVFVVLSYTAVHHHMRQMLAEQLAATAQDAQEAVEAPLREGLRDLSAWTRQVTMQDVLVDDSYGDIQRELVEIIRRYPIVDALAVVNEKDVIVAATDPALMRQSLAGEVSVREAKSRGVWYGLVGPSRISGRDGLPVAMPILASYDRTKVVGVLLAVFDWSIVRQELGRIEVLGHHQDADHQILLASRRQGRLLHGALDDPDLVTSLVRLPGHAIDALAVGGREYVAWRPGRDRSSTEPPFSDWSVAVVASQEVATHTIRQFTDLAILVAVVGGVLTVLLGYAASRHLSRPIRDVTEALSRVAAGERDVALSFGRRNDEIGEMAAALQVFGANLMAMERLANEKAEIEANGRQALADALEAMQQPVALWGAAGHFVLGNRAFDELMESFGIPATALEKFSYHDIEYGLLQVGLVETARETAPPDGRRHTEMDVNLADGRVLRVLEYATSDGGTVSAWFDITGFRRRETALAMLANDRNGDQPFAALAVEALAVGLGLRWAGLSQLSEDGTVATLAAVWPGEQRPSFSYPLHGTPCETVVAGRDVHVIEDGAGEQYAAVPPFTEMPGRSYVGLSYRAANGRVVGHLFAIGDAPIRLSADDRQFLWVIVRWVEAQHERSKAVEQLSYQANYDPLTGLPNRNLALDRLGLELARARRYGSSAAVLFIDLDNFKTVNDTLGHMIGDELLRLASQRLSGCLRQEDTVARLGGDEFLVILAATPESARAEVVARKIVEACGRPFTIQGHELFVTASIGITIYPDDGQTPSEILRNADSAMYLAKERGRNSWQYFTPQLNERANQRLMIEGRLRHALERNELLLHYHPLVSLVSGRMEAAEALLRWNSPELGLVAPDRFIPIAEESDLIISMGRFVIETACRDLADWHAAGLTDMRVAVNVSSRQFQDDGLVDTVAQAIRDNGLDPSQLELEITERMLLKKDVRTSSVIDRLRALGVRFAIDDFGTGYSAMSYLTAFPLDVLKIDRSFVCKASQSLQDAKLAHAIIAMAHSLELEVVGEGAEDRADVDFLRRHGCDFVQGFYYSPPMPNEAFKNWARTFAAQPAEAGPAVAAAQ